SFRSVMCSYVMPSSHSICSTSCRRLLTAFSFTTKWPTEIYTLSYTTLFRSGNPAMIRKVLIANRGEIAVRVARACADYGVRSTRDRKSTRLNSSHVKISYAVFCLKKKRPGHRHLPQLPYPDDTERRVHVRSN